jgi:pyrimidine-nucleoside phosphorylase
VNAVQARGVVAAKRDGEHLSAPQLRGFVDAYSRREIPDYLAAAFLMAVYIRGLDEEETLELTRAMVGSGRILELGGVSGPKVDKHSTGGVADGVTLVFAPLAAALGIRVAKLSGRGLGHTGGTLDKLESIPGLRTDLSPEELERQVESVGCAVAAQSPDLAPADGALYALRDATATVSSIPLIAASVMSKKLAIETDLILLDVKAGSGAFMKSPEAARALAETCVGLARGWGRPCRAAVTDMSQPLGEAIGNALDIEEAVAVLSGRGGGRLRDLAVMFAGEALARVGETSMGEGRGRAARALDSGEALERFGRMVEAQGGDPRVTEDPRSVLPRAPVIHRVASPQRGVLESVDAEEIGRASVELGAGRIRKDDPVDPAVGIVFRLKVGDPIEAGEEIATVHARSEDQAGAAERRLLGAMVLSDGPVEPPPIVYGWHE